MSQAPWEELGSEISRLLDVSTPRTRARVAGLYAACRGNAVDSAHSVSKTSTTSAVSSASMFHSQFDSPNESFVGRIYPHHHRDPSTGSLRSPPAAAVQSMHGGPIVVLPHTPTCLTSFWTSSTAHQSTHKWLIAATLQGNLYTYCSGGGSDDPPWHLAGSCVSVAPHGTALCLDVLQHRRDTGLTTWVVAGTSTGAVVVNRFEPQQQHHPAAIERLGGGPGYHVDDIASPPITPFGLGLTCEFDGIRADGGDELNDSDRFASPVSSSQAPSKELVLIPWAPGRSKGARRGVDDDDVDSLHPPSDSNAPRGHSADDDDGAGDGIPCGGVGSMIISGSDSRSSLGSSPPSSEEGFAVEQPPPVSATRRLHLRSPPAKSRVTANQHIPLRRMSTDQHCGGGGPLMTNVGNMSTPSRSAALLSGSVTALTSLGGGGEEQQNHAVLWGTRNGEIHLAELEQFFSSSSSAAAADNKSVSQLPLSSASSSLPFFSGRIIGGAPITRLRVLTNPCSIAAATWDGVVWVFDTRAGHLPVSVAPPCRRASASATTRGRNGMERAFHTIAAGFGGNQSTTSSTGGSGLSGAGLGAPVRSLFAWDDDAHYGESAAPTSLLAAADDDGIVRLLDTRRFLSVSSIAAAGSTSFSKAQSATAEVWALRAGHKPIVFASRQRSRDGFPSQSSPLLTVCFKDNSIKRLHVKESSSSGGTRDLKKSSSGGDSGERPTPTGSPRLATHSDKTLIRAKRGAAGVCAYVEQHVELDTSATRSLGATVACTELLRSANLDHVGAGCGAASSLLIQGLSGGVVSCLPIW
jgi:hypothetical protein